MARDLALAIGTGTKDYQCDCGPSSVAVPAAPVEAEPPARGLAPVLDQALPLPSATLQEVTDFLTASRDVGFRSVCVQPVWAALAVRMLRGSATRAAAFIGFPQATALTPTKCLEAELLLRNGIKELTMMADIGALRSGDLDAVYIDIKAVAGVAACRDARLNVFLELPLLDERRKLEACVVAKLAGAAAVMSATGFNESNAEPADIGLMSHVVGGELDVVAAGGVHSAAAVRRMLAAGAHRVCTSHGLEIVGGA